jgi:pimeloyl-ACP methyl ester carboxylesterase
MSRTTGRARRRAVIAVTAPLAVLGLLAACSFPDPDGPDPVRATPAATSSGPASGVKDPATQAEFATFYGQQVDWTGCGGEFECTRVRVPLDWSKPSGEVIEIAVNKLPASGTSIGALVVNPGGPGASGLEFARAADQVFGKAVLQAYDIVGFDPRGVGQSDPVTCLRDSQLEPYLASDGTPDSPAELTSAVAGQENFGKACQQNTGALLAHVDTVSAVKDLDVLRAVLGDDLLGFYGASYGTYMGAWYGQLFPWRVGRMVLDGAIDPTLSAAQYVEGQSEGFQRAMKAFVRDCQSQGECPLTGSLSDGLAQIGELVTRADSAPLRTDDPGRVLTQSLMTTGIAQALYASQLWPSLTIALSNAKTGDGTGLLALADAYLQRDARGHYGQVNSANPAIYCLDLGETRTPQQIGADAAKVQAQYPPLGGAIAWSALSCASWPLKPTVPRQKLTAEGAAPILVLGTVDDPATPYEWAQALASQLSSGHLVTWEGSVHTAYRKGSECVDDATETYLLTGALPAKNLRCS